MFKNVFQTTLFLKRKFYRLSNCSLINSSTLVWKLGQTFYMLRIIKILGKDNWIVYKFCIYMENRLDFWFMIYKNKSKNRGLF